MGMLRGWGLEKANLQNGATRWYPVLIAITAKEGHSWSSKLTLWRSRHESPQRAKTCLRCRQGRCLNDRHIARLDLLQHYMSKCGTRHMKQAAERVCDTSGIRDWTVVDATGPKSNITLECHSAHAHRHSYWHRTAAWGRGARAKGCICTSITRARHVRGVLPRLAAGRAIDDGPIRERSKSINRAAPGPIAHHAALVHMQQVPLAHQGLEAAAATLVRAACRPATLLAAKSLHMQSSCATEALAAKAKHRDHGTAQLPGCIRAV